MVHEVKKSTMMVSVKSDIYDYSRITQKSESNISDFEFKQKC